MPDDDERIPVSGRDPNDEHESGDERGREPDAELDPLKTLLDEQVRPLPPPPGTFDLIARKARRRKLRKVATTTASVAAVAAGVVIAVSHGTLLNLTTPTEKASVAAGTSTSRAGSAKGPNSSQQPAGTGTPAPTPSAPAVKLPASTGGDGVNGGINGAGQPYLGPVPRNFAPMSVTFVSATHAWVIGQAGAPGSCYNGSICTSVAWTGDGGKSWHGEPAPVTGPPAGASGVSGIRFLDGVNGWAYGPQLWVTHNAGNTWHQISTGGQRVTDLETAGDRAYALFASCTGGSGFASGCTSYTLMTTTKDSDNWQPVGAATSGLTASGAGSSGSGSGDSGAMLALTGSQGYLLAPDGTVYSGPLGGTWQKAGTAPCTPGPAQANGLPSRALLAPMAARGLALACEGLDGTNAINIATSSDGGASWLSPAEANVPGTPTSLSAAPDHTLVLATTSGIYTLPSGGAQWQTASSGASAMPSGGFSYVGMTDSSNGVALPADSSLHEIWLTTDGGRTWAPSPIS